MTYCLVINNIKYTVNVTQTSNTIHTFWKHNENWFMNNMNTITYYLRMKNGKASKNQINCKGAWKRITYILRLYRQGELVRWTSQKHQKQSLTRWGCADQEKWSDGLLSSIKNSHIHAEDVQTRRNNQMDSTETSRTVTYMLRMCREMVRWTSQKHPETVTYILRMYRQGELVRWTSQKHQEQSITFWECVDKEKCSDGLHKSIKNSHLHAENMQTRRNAQMDFTEASRTVTYILRIRRNNEMDFTEASRTITYKLRMCRQREMVRWTSQKHQKQSLTFWECADKVNWSDGLHRSIKNSHIHAENVQTRRNGQMDFTEASKTVTYTLRMCRQGEFVRWTSQKHQKQSLTFWECADKVNWSDRLHRSIKNSHLQTEDAQTRINGQMDFTEASKTVTYKLRMCRQGGQMDFT